MKEYSELLKQDFSGKNVLIIGCPASGKTFLSNQLNATDHIVIHTDDYMKHGYEKALYVILDELQTIQNKTIIEGVQGYRLLRKGVQLNNYYPDVVIELKISESRMLETYSKERDEKKSKYLKGFNGMHSKIINDYFVMNNPNKPEWITIMNNY